VPAHDFNVRASSATLTISVVNVQVEPLTIIPTATWPMPGQESSHVRSIRSAGSYDDIEPPGEADCRPEKLAALVEHGLLDHVVRTPQH